MKIPFLNQKMKNLGFLLETSTAFSSVGKEHKWAFFKCFIKWLRISFTTNRVSAGDLPSNKILAQPKAERPQLKPSVCLSTGRNVTSSLPFFTRRWTRDFKHFSEIDVRLVRRLSHIWTLPLEVNANCQWQLPSCSNWICSPETGKYVDSVFWQFNIDW